MNKTLIYLSVVALGFATLATVAKIINKNDVIATSYKLDVQSINDNMLGLRSEKERQFSNTNHPLNPNSKSAWEQLNPSAVMITDKNLDHYFLPGKVTLGFEEYYVLEFASGRALICPTPAQDEKCERLTRVIRHSAG